MMLDARPMDDQLSRLTEAHALLMRANANLQALPATGSTTRNSTTCCTHWTSA